MVPELHPRSLNRRVLHGRREAVAPPLRARFAPAPLSLGVSLSVGPALPPRSLLLVLLRGCRAQPRIPPSRLLESVSLAAAAGKGSRGAQQHRSGRRGSPFGAGAGLSCPSSLPGRVSSLRRPSPLRSRLWLLSEAGGAGSRHQHRDPRSSVSPRARRSADSCPATPDRRGVPQGRVATKRSRQRGPCGG